MNNIKYCEHCACERPVTIDERKSTYKFRKESFEIIEKYVKCNSCSNDVYDEETANHTLKQLSDLYSGKHSMFKENIKEIRKSTGLTQSLFAKVLNMGEATIKRYESGASLPDATQLSVLKMLKGDPSLITNFYEENKDLLNEQDQIYIEEKLKSFTSNKLEKSTFQILQLLYNKYENKIDNGNSIFDPGKLFQMILFFSRDGVLKTKLMKLLWYADFLMFKRNRRSISGTPYWHLEFGPVPIEHDTVLGCGKGLNIISIEEEEDISTGYTKMIVKAKTSYNPDFFKQEEISVLNFVEEFFHSYGSRAISEFSHQEEGWKQTKQEELISYLYAETLKLN